MSATLCLRIGRGTIEARVERRGRVMWSGAASYEVPADLVEAIAQLAAEESMTVRPDQAMVELVSPFVQTRTLHGLPPVRPHALRELVAHQAGRFFRRGRGGDSGAVLVTDPIWERRARRKGGETIARAAAIEESWLEAIASGLRAAGLRLQSVRPADTPPNLALDLLPPSDRAHRRAATWLAVRRLGFAAFALWCVAGAIAITRVRREQDRVNRELATLDAPVKAVLAARRSLGAAAAVIETIDSAAERRAAVLAATAAIIAALPDSAYLTSLDVDATGSGTLTGSAQRAAQVVAALKQSDVVRHAELTGPVVRELVAGHEWERFTVRLGKEKRP